jgi:hypothetical protein
MTSRNHVRGEIREFLIARRAKIAPKQEFRVRWAAHDVD